jgi:hypothetical protein
MHHKSHLQDDWSHQTLDLGCLESLLLAFLESEWTLDDVLTHIVFLREVEELANVTGALGSEATWNIDIGQSGNFLFTFADNDECKSGKILINDASSDGFAFTLASTTWSVA